MLQVKLLLELHFVSHPGSFNASQCSSQFWLVFWLTSIALYFQCQRLLFESEDRDSGIPLSSASLHRGDLAPDDQRDAWALCCAPWGSCCDAWLHGQTMSNHFDSNSTWFLQIKGNACAASARIICRTQKERSAEWRLRGRWYCSCPSRAPGEKGPWAKVIICKHAALWQFNFVELNFWVSLVYHLQLF